MTWDKQHVQSMIGMMGYAPGTGKNEHVWKQTVDGKVYGVDFREEEVFMFIGTDRLTDVDDDTFRELQNAVEYANASKEEGQESAANNPSTTEEIPETPAKIPSEPEHNKPVETPRVPASRAPTSPTPARRTTSNSSLVVPGYTREQIETIKNTVAKGATDSELQMFMHVAQTYGLDPFLKEIFYSDKMHTIITSRDGYLKAAQRDPEFEGIQSMAVCENDDFEIDVVAGTVKHAFGKGSRGKVIGAWAICSRKDRKPVISYASYDEYNQNNTIWSKYKSAMCCKVAEVFSLKRQFGISGLVTQEEIGVEVV